MASMQLADGRIINNLIINGDNFISSREITDDIFDTNLSSVIIEIDGVETVHEAMKLIQITHPSQNEWWFVIQDMTPEELYRLGLEAKLDYIAMMAGIDLGRE